MKAALAIIFAFIAFVAAAANITHKATADFFSYVENGPIGSGWSENVPSAYIPGGVNPSNAISRLTDAQTRHAFVGTFDAYFRRLMASVAFGTAETEDYNKGYTADPQAFEIADAADWRTDAVIPKVFTPYATNGWYLAANRDYAVTNINVTVTNWVGWTTNIVRTASGKVKVAISNRYEVTTETIPDTSRILDRYKTGHDYVRGFGKLGRGDNPNGLRYLVDIRPGDWILDTDGYIDSDAYNAFVWPQREYIVAFWPRIRTYTNHQHQVVTETNYFDNVIWSTDDLIGWSFSQIDSMWTPPQGIGDPFAWTTDGEWHEHLKDCVAEGGWGWFFPTTWDLFDAPFSRKRVAAAFFDKAQSAGHWLTWDGLLDYPYTCPDEWAELIRSVCHNPFGSMRIAITNADDSVDLLPVGTAGFAMLTNLTEISVALTHEYVATNISPSGSGGLVTNVVEAVVTNRQALAHIVPDVKTFQRIDWAEWAGDNGFLALADTAIAGPWAMPSLLYEIAQTNVSVDVTYGFPTNSSSFITIHGWVGSDRWTVTNAALSIARLGQSVNPGTGQISVEWHRNESAMVDPWLSIYGYGYPGKIWRSPSSDYEVGIGENRLCDAKADVRGWLEGLVNIHPDQSLHVGDLVYLTWGVSSVTDPWGNVVLFIDADWTCPHGGQGGHMQINTLPNPEFYITIQELYISGSADALMETTKAVRPFAHNLNRQAFQTNSIPCAYPNPSYAGSDEKVEKVANIKATTLSAICSTTNVEYYGGDYYYRPDGWATNGYRFAFATDLGSTAKFVDQTFQTADYLLGSKMTEMAEEASGLHQTDNAQALGNEILSMFDEGVIANEGRSVIELIEGMMNETESGPLPANFGFMTYYDPGWILITQTEPDVDFETVRQDTNGVWQITGEPLWRCISAHIGYGSTNEVVQKRGVSTHGRVTGVEAVKWDFDAMKRARELNQ